jgi:hypothetical protein
MSLSEWRKNGWLKVHDADPAEIHRLFEVIERDLRVGNSAHTDPDWRFVAAYNAALQAANIALFASGFEAAKGGGAHYYAIESLKLTIEDDGAAVDELQAFKSKRGGIVYEMTGIATETEIKDLCRLATDLRNRVASWLKQKHPELLSKARKKK